MRELRRGMDAVIDLNQVYQLVIHPLIQRAIRAKHRYGEKNEQTPKRARHQTPVCNCSAANVVTLRGSVTISVDARDVAVRHPKEVCVTICRLTQPRRASRGGPPHSAGF